MKQGAGSTQGAEAKKSGQQFPMLLRLLLEETEGSLVWLVSGMYMKKWQNSLESLGFIDSV